MQMPEHMLVCIIPADASHAKHLVVQPPAILEDHFLRRLTHNEQCIHASLVPELAPLQMQPFNGGA